MVRRKGLGWVCMVVLLFVCSPVSAQEEDPDAFEQSLMQYRSFFDYGGFQPDLESILPKGAVSRWTAHAGVTATYSDNVDKDAREKDAFWSDGVVGLGYTRQTPRLTGTADYRYNFPIYQSDNADERDEASHRVAGALRWQAARHFRLSGGGHFAQDLEQGLVVATPGLPATYDNRTNEYGAHAEYDWRLGRGTTNRGTYRFTLVDYVSGDSAGQDVRRHDASESLGVQWGGLNSANLSYGYGSEEELDTDYHRQNHSGTVSWTRQLVSFPSPDRSQLSFSYRFQRILYDGTETDDVWDHSVNAEYRFHPGPHTDVGINGGYQYIKPDEGDAETGWNAGADVRHDFSPYTTGYGEVFRHLVYRPEDEDVQDTVRYRVSLDHQFTRYTDGSASVSQTWEYVEPTSTGTATELTKTLRVTASLNSRLAERVDGSLRGGYLEGDPQGTLGADNNYWEATGSADLTTEMSPGAFLGAGYTFIRRMTEESNEDYRLHRGRLFHRRTLLTWLSARLEYSYERRDHDAASDRADYDENRIFGSLTANW